ncbi:MAG: SDR family NAD(P)-dependent oxidoreductase [Porphyromonadaceae bacterium]|nr:SDR family NAD(P)-dependent oxidoreductase [Porphyromonadaceae bacterium]
MSKTALITGASKGIGKELAFLLAEKGHDLVLVARSAEALKKIKIELEETCSVSVHTLVVDLCDAVSAQAVFDEVKKEGIDIDYLVNNAGFGDYNDEGKNHRHSRRHE